MRSVANREVTHPLVRRVALSIIAHCDVRDTECHYRQLRAWISGHVRFARDPVGVELLHTPVYMLTEIAERYYVQGDCDDVAILAAALAKAVGLPARFVAVAFVGHVGYMHVFAEVLVRGRWREMDTTRPMTSAAIVDHRPMIVGV